MPASSSSMQPSSSNEHDAAQSAPVWKLVAVSGFDDGLTIPLTEEGVQLGRSDECQVMLPSQNVSRKHARVFLFQGQPYIQDLGSRNGVFVNGVRVQQQGLAEGDSVAMGEFVFRVSHGAAKAKGGRSRRPLLYGVAALAILFIAGLALTRSGTSNSQPSPVVENTSPKGADKGIGAMLKALEDSGDEPEARAPDKGTTKPGGTDEEALAEAMKRRDQMVREYLERAQLLWDAGKLTDAYQQYQRALTLDPSCQLCLSRRERIQNEIAALVQRHMDEGIKAFKALRYDEAIESWELVLNLSPDPGSQPHQMATKYIADANARLESQRR